MTGHIVSESTNACPTSPTTDIQPELLPCPFCGDRDEYNPSLTPVQGYAEPGNESAGLIDTGWLVECDKCTGLGPCRTTRAEAISAWNTRLTSTTPTLEDMVERVAQAMWASEDEPGTLDASGRRGTFERLAHAALSAAPASPASPIPTSVANEGEREAMVRYVTHYGPRCRDCADEDGVCPATGIGCGQRAKAVAFVVDALIYGAKHGYLPAALSPALDNTAVEGQDRRECQSVWRCAIGDFTGALDVLKNRWIGSRRKAEREAGAVLSGVLDLVWAARDPAAGCYSEAATNGKALIERVRAAFAETEKAR